MNKKAIAILGVIFLLIVATLGVIIYLRSRGDSTPEPIPTPPTIIQDPVIDFPPFEEPEPVVPQANATRLTDEAVITPALFFQGNGIAYFNRQGQLFRTDMAVSGSTVLLSNKTELTIPAKAGISRILWPAVGSSFIAESGIGLARQWSYYNPATGEYVELPRQVKSLSWLPSGDKIMFVWVDDNGNASLNISNPDTTDYQTLTELYDNDLEIYVSPDGQTVLFHRRQTTDMSQNGLFTVTPDGRTFDTITRDGYNRGVLWSPDSRKFLFTRRDLTTQQYSLWFGDLASGEIRNLGLNTSETKAVWSRDSQSIVVAVPTSGTAGTGVTSDTIYVMNVLTSTREEYNPGGGIDAQEMFLSLDEQIVFFRNAQDGALYYMFLN
ncbi:MAG TPA: hypothetical protein PKD79_00695 [Candidatus Doudnabacteria bacterium]|nr:hypothetical protein [Candidatus Doudnabacteria bacterium]